MDVILADHAGTCFGVQRALDLAYEVAQAGKPAMTLGSLIHNPRVVESLSAQGVSVAGSPDEVTTPVVVIRSHGVLPQVRDELDARGLEVVDATCPFVLRAQKKAAALAADGGDVVIVGEAGHPEVEGLTAWAERAGARVWVAGGADDLPQDLSDPVGVVVQTTQRRAVLDEVVDALRSTGRQVTVEDTICAATTERQDAARELAGRVDAMVVIGGRNSSNTTRLAEVCRALGTRTVHIESADELDGDFFTDCDTVGVTAGASTPHDQVEEVVATLESFGR